MKQTTNFKRLFLLLWLLPAVALVIQTGSPVAWGQEADTAEPVNLSRSGGAGAPFAVVDAAGSTHVVWEDESLGTMYTREEGDAWREPVAVTVPFAEEQPLLKADSQGRIHAFWHNEDYELFYSRVNVDNFAEAAAWTVPQQLAASALAFDVVVTENGRLHLAYVRQLETEDAPAGIYYRQSGTGETVGDQSNWSAAQLLERAAYFRSAVTGHIQIAHAPLLGHVYVAWDNQALDQVFVTRSDDNGQSFQDPIQVDQREPTDTSDAVGPSSIRVATQRSDIHLIWQAGHGGVSCALYHQRSRDGGQTWDTQQRMWDQCFSTAQFLGIHDGLLMLLLARDDGVYLQAWDGQRWSEPQRQPAATSFSNPDTFRNTSLGCHQADMGSGRVVIVGCGLNVTRDVWFLERALGEPEAWFPPPSIWQPPRQVAVQNRLIEGVVAPTLLSTGEDQMHLFWHWPHSPEIYYSSWDGTRWLLQPAQILNAFGEGQIELAVLSSVIDRFSAVWSDRQTGRIYFSQVSIGQAALSSAWLDSLELPTPQEIAQSPAILRLSDGRLLLAYTAPINEGRGIYTLTSADRGTTWSEPAQVFDGAEAGWPVVGRPYLTQTDGDELHMLWLQGSLANRQVANRLVYAYSTDNGETWSAPETVVEETAVSNPLIIGVGQRDVHRIWQTHADNDRVSLWHQHSTDNGRSWSRATAIGGTTTGGLYTLIKDPAGGVHLLRIIDLALEHWQWDGSQWINQEGITLRSGEGNNTSILGLAAAVSPRYGLVVAYVQTERVQVEEQFQWRTGIYATGRDLEDLDIVPAPTLVATPTSQPVQMTPSPTAMPSPTPAIPLNDLETGDRPASDNTMLGMVMGVLAAALVVGVVFVFGLRAMRSG